MYRHKRILAVIPARGGSKGIPDKNIRELKGIPLIAYSILAAKRCKYIDDILVSTDSANIAETAGHYGAWIPFFRPKNLAQDDSKTIDCLVYTIERLKEMGKEYDYLMLLQPTQPFRRARHLEESIEITVDKGCGSLVSVTKAEESPVLMRTLGEDGRLKRILDMPSTVRRQEFPAVYRVNGSIYINKLGKSFDQSVSLNDNEYPYFMDRAYSMDIDTMEDLKMAERMLMNKEVKLDED